MSSFSPFSAVSCITVTIWLTFTVCFSIPFISRMQYTHKTYSPSTQTHWHSFFVLSDLEATMVLSSNVAAPLKQKPLLPKILPISFKKEEIFRQLARISRSTRGIVILLCDLKLARVIMSEAQRLNMVGGHFIWIWADTSTNNEFFDQVHPDEMESEIDDNLDLISLVDREKQLQQQQQKHQHVQQNVGRDQMGGYPDEITIDTKQHYEPKNEYETIESLDNTNFHLYEDLLERRLDFDSEFESTNRGLSGSHNLTHELPLGPDGAYNPFQHSIVSQVGYGKRQLTDGLTAPINVQDKIETHDTDDHDDDELHLDSMLGLDDNLESFKLRTRRNPFLPFMTTYNNNNSGKTNKYNFNNNNNNNNDDVNSDENIMDPMNANDINKMKRVNLLNQLDISSSHVLFHNFQDFPIGLLILRPIKMLTDRHFIRSAVRLFATTWAKLERNSNSNLYGQSNNRDDDKPYRFKNIRNKREDEGREEQTSTTSSSSATTLSKSNNKPSADTSHVNTYVNINSIWEPEQIVTKTKQQTSGLSENKNEKIEKSNKFTTTTRFNNVNTNTVDDNDAINIAMKSKRFDSSWWPSIGGGGRDTSKNKQQKQKQSSSGEDRIKNRGTPQYKGGCFGAPTRGDIKRAELFARYVKYTFQI